VVARAAQLPLTLDGEGKRDAIVDPSPPLAPHDVSDEILQLAAEVVRVPVRFR